MRKPFLVLGILTALSLPIPARAQLAADAAKPPVAKQIPKTTVLHGDTRVDNYDWLRGKSKPEVIDYLEAENAYTKAVMKPTESFQEALYKEMLSHIKQTDLSVPYRLGGYHYYSRTEQGKQYPILCRKRGSLEAAEEIYLDLNELAKGQKFLGLGATAISDDGNLLAYATDVTGFRQYTLHVKDLRNGQVLPTTISNVTGAQWAADNKTLFYVIEDAAKRAYRLYRLVPGSGKEEKLYEETDALYRIGLSKTRDRKYLILTSVSSTTTEVHCLPSDQPTGELRVVLPRQVDHRYSVDHRNGLFYIETNKNAKNFRLVTAPADKPQPENWTEMIPHRPDVLLERIELFANHMVVAERTKGLQTIRVFDLRTNKDEPLEFPEPVYSLFPANNPEFETNAFRFSYQSFITPSSVFEYDMGSRQRKLLKQTEVPGGYHPERYKSERIFATATDGTKVPISLVYREGTPRDGTSPLLLYGYGSYGASMPVAFQSNRLSLLDRGVTFAMAHIRGGKEMGETWHDQGKMMNKRNTFTDFIACADHLMAEKYTARERLAIEGGSAGGLLIGAVLNLRPVLCKVAVLHVPFVDVINTMLDETLPLTIGEFLEWGNPKVKAEYEYMKSYCPYTNLAAREYPATLVMTSLNDSQVMYWEPAKYVAKLRSLKTDANVLLLKTNMAAGHGGSSGRYDALKEAAFAYAFVLNELGISK
jgi:oligopeptidase B